MKRLLDSEFGFVNFVATFIYYGKYDFKRKALLISNADDYVKLSGRKAKFKYILEFSEKVDGWVPVPVLCHLALFAGEKKVKPSDIEFKALRTELQKKAIEFEKVFANDWVVVKRDIIKKKIDQITKEIEVLTNKAEELELILEDID